MTPMGYSQADLNSDDGDDFGDLADSILSAYYDTLSAMVDRMADRLLQLYRDHPQEYGEAKLKADTGRLKESLGITLIAIIKKWVGAVEIQVKVLDDRTTRYAATNVYDLPPTDELDPEYLLDDMQSEKETTMLGIAREIAWFMDNFGK